MIGVGGNLARATRAMSFEAWAFWLGPVTGRQATDPPMPDRCVVPPQRVPTRRRSLDNFIDRCEHQHPRCHYKACSASGHAPLRALPSSSISTPIRLVAPSKRVTVAMGKLIRLELFSAPPHSTTSTRRVADHLTDFKSYRGHHVLLFGDSHFTSIIGPNGSGKSNS